MLSDGLLRSRYLARDTFDAGASIQLDFPRRIFRKGAQRTSTFTGLTGAAFSRASIGYAGTWRGQPKSFASGAPRITDLGMLCEPAATNMLLHSQTLQDVTAWSPSQCTVTANAGIAPDGTATADKVTVNAGQQVFRTAIQQALGSLTGVYNFSVYVKPVDSRYVSIGDAQGLGWLDAQFDLVNGTVNALFVGANPRITPLADGWFRVSCDTVNKGVATLFNPVVDMVNSTATGYPIGDGNRGLLLWGAQVTAGEGEKSYIPTTTASATRLADAPTLSYAQPAACTFVTEFIVPAFKGETHQVFLGTPTKQLLYFNVGFLDLRTQPGSEILLNPGAPVRGQVYRAALSFGGGNVKGCGTGAVAVTTTAAAAPDLSSLIIGSGNSGLGCSTFLRKLLVFDRAFSDAELLAAVGV